MKRHKHFWQFVRKETSLKIQNIGIGLCKQGRLGVYNAVWGSCAFKDEFGFCKETQMLCGSNL